MTGAIDLDAWGAVKAAAVKEGVDILGQEFLGDEAPMSQYAGATLTSTNSIQEWVGRVYLDVHYRMHELVEEAVGPSDDEGVRDVIFRMAEEARLEAISEYNARRAEFQSADEG